MNFLIVIGLMGVSFVAGGVVAYLEARHIKATAQKRLDELVTAAASKGVVLPKVTL